MRYFLIIALVVLSGCASSPRSGDIFQPAEEAEDEALVYFYRPGTFFMNMADVNIFINDELSLVLGNGTYVKKYLRPGIYSFKAKEKRGRFGGYSAALGGVEYSIEYELQKNNTYYIAWYPSVSYLSSRYESKFVVSNHQNPSGILDGGVVDIAAEFGVVENSFGFLEISKTKESKSVVDPEKI